MASDVTIRWTPHVRLSAVHGAYVAASGGRCVDAKIESVLVPPATGINNRLVSASVDVGRFWRRLVAEVAAERSDRDQDETRACEIALIAAGLSEMQLEQTAKAIVQLLGECRTAFLARYPKLADQLRLRAQPLGERWSAYGPGLLRAAAARIWDGDPPADWWPGRVEGLLMQPVRGGDGGFDAEGQRFWIEAMLTDADPAVPEVLRVAWLVTRMAVDRHTREKSGEHSHRLPWSWASVPIVLAAAADLDLIPPGRLPIAAGMKRWHLGDDEIAATVEDWWQQQASTEAAMPVALKALDRMLQARPRRSGDGGSASAHGSGTLRGMEGR